ncbi:hypothetical protein LUW77_08175 [Streptomyces radiopugnans]|nr:hypothetical protein LUW77_08175 [Streptomyces radiopugnans]
MADADLGRPAVDGQPVLPGLDAHDPQPAPLLPGVHLGVLQAEGLHDGTGRLLRLLLGDLPGHQRHRAGERPGAGGGVHGEVPVLAADRPGAVLPADLAAHLQRLRQLGHLLLAHLPGLAR